MNRLFSKGLASSMLAGAAALLAAPAAHADFINFEAVSNVPSATLQTGTSVYKNGDRFLSNGYQLTTHTSAASQANNMVGLGGAIVNGGNYYNCDILACPSGNLSNYYAGVNDGSVDISRGGELFRLSALNFAFVSPLSGLGDGVYGQLSITGLLANGTAISTSRDFAGQDVDGFFTFSNWNLDKEFARLAFTSLSISACMFDGNGGCFNPAGNDAQFAIDDLDVNAGDPSAAVPLPGTVPLMLLGMAGMALVSRRRNSSK